MSEGQCNEGGCTKVEQLRRGKCYAHYWDERSAELEACSITNCDNPATRRSLCGKHYTQWRKTNGSPCSVEGCSTGVVGFGWCLNHLRRWQKYGDPLASSPRIKCKWPNCDQDIILARNKSGYCTYHITRAWKKAHPEAVNKSNREYNARNPDLARSWRDKWLADNPTYLSEWQKLRYQRILDQYIEFVDRDVLLARDRGICGICSQEVDPDNWHVDHIIPVSRGGEHSYANVQVSHPACNSRKGAKLG